MYVNPLHLFISKWYEHSVLQFILKQIIKFISYGNYLHRSYKCHDISLKYALKKSLKFYALDMFCSGNYTGWLGIAALGVIWLNCVKNVSILQKVKMSDLFPSLWGGYNLCFPGLLFYFSSLKVKGRVI